MLEALVVDRNARRVRIMIMYGIGKTVKGAALVVITARQRDGREADVGRAWNGHVPGTGSRV